MAMERFANYCDGVMRRRRSFKVKEEQVEQVVGLRITEEGRGLGGMECFAGDWSLSSIRSGI